MSSRRKVAMIISALWAAIFFFYLFPSASKITPIEWPVIAVLFTIILGGFASAAVMIEILRVIIPEWGSLDDKRHFNRVMVLFVIFVGLIAGGYRMVLEGYGG